ncbi:MAG: betaine/proline/choline family ABC transporter ATP-binding protein [Gammaproteobacteria bacterium]|nr:betaine/proline/choline family ABC transporter ATP-binding protein [Gammaproteobacteria bacterium]MCY4217877.1 betaine/proline/choline family ABC transporter ATP-binding protein [Gammaproteobacteria bacterium]MCY4276217.1 betaine/proline/choline family ABC transporter ATP-binding protein [Gammaproteobacteria bacterium]
MKYDKQLPQDTEPVIECRNLWKIFGDDSDRAMAAIISEGLNKENILKRFGCIVGVQDVSFSVSEGEIFCVMGLSGSGKSTLIRHLNRLVEPTAGEVWIEGENISTLSPTGLRDLRASKMGMVFQNMALMPHRTVRENVAFALEVRGYNRKKRFNIANNAIEIVELAGWGNRYPDELSGGMQQRVGLARAIAADPHFLLMDEPFSALDPLIRRQLQDQFLKLAKEMKKTTLFITHDLDEAIRIGDRIAIMREGMLVQVGTPEQIVMEPKDAYVADFVAGISKLHLVTAARIMESLTDYETRTGQSLNKSDLLTACPDDTLDRLAELSIDTDAPLMIEKDGTHVGIVTKKALIRGIQGRLNNVVGAE